MADELKVPPQPTGPGETPAKSPVAEGGGTATPATPPGKSADAALPKAASAEAVPKPQPPVPVQPSAVAPEGGSAPAKPAAPPKPAVAAPPKPPAPPKAPVKAEPWTSPLLEELGKRFPGAVADASIFRNQPCVTIAKESLIGICEFLKSDEGGAYTYLADETAVDYPKREKRFEIIYVLYSFRANNRLRLKVLVGDTEKTPSVVGVWPAANWLEREVFDMFGVAYEGHPDLRRILMPDGWVGHPLRKDYDILRQDQAWVQANLHIESGQ